MSTYAKAVAPAPAPLTDAAGLEHTLLSATGSALPCMATYQCSCHAAQGTAFEVVPGFIGTPTQLLAAHVDDVNRKAAAS